MIAGQVQIAMTKENKNKKKKIRNSSGKQERVQSVDQNIWGLSGRYKTDKIRLLETTTTEQLVTQHRENYCGQYQGS